MDATLTRPLPRNEIQRSLRLGPYQLPPLPANSEPDLLYMLDEYVALLKAGDDRADDKWLQVLAEVERLQGIEYAMREAA